MRTVETKIYKFEELSEDVQKKLIEKEQEFNYDAEWICKELTEEFSYRLGKAYYPNDKIEWRLGYCQGDGVAFYGYIDRDNIRNLIKKVMPKSSPERKKLLALSKDFLYNLVDFVEIQRNDWGYHYSHYNTMKLSYDLTVTTISETTDKYFSWFDEFIKYLLKDIKDTSRELERFGYEYLEGFQSEEYARECLENTDTEYDEYGRVYWK